MSRGLSSEAAQRSSRTRAMTAIGTHLPFTAIWRDGRSRRRSRNCRARISPPADWCGVPSLAEGGRARSHSTDHPCASQDFRMPCRKTIRIRGGRHWDAYGHRRTAPRPAARRLRGLPSAPAARLISSTWPHTRVKNPPAQQRATPSIFR